MRGPSETHRNDASSTSRGRCFGYLSPSVFIAYLDRLSGEPALNAGGERSQPIRRRCGSPCAELNMLYLNIPDPCNTRRAPSSV